MTPFRPNTSNGRYFGVRSRLWRRANPGVPDAKRKALVSRLMARVVQSARQAIDATALATALDAVNPTKIALCDRGPFWRTDASPDLVAIWLGPRPVRTGSHVWSTGAAHEDRHLQHQWH